MQFATFLLKSVVRPLFLIPLFSVGICPSHANAAEQVVLWNSLGSEYEVTHSGIGPNGVIDYGDQPISYSPVKFGNGIKVLGVGGDRNPTAVTFDVSSDPSLSGNKGAFAFWVKPDHDSHYFGIARWLISEYDHPFSPGIYWRGWDQAIAFFACAAPIGCSDSNHILVPNSKFSFRAGDVFHVALVWDRDGIDGTSDTLRAYINGELYGSKAGTWNADQKVGSPIMGRKDYPQSAVVDNLVVWNDAKTDFSDRFNESPVGQEFATFNARAKLTLGRKPNDDSYRLSGFLSLAPDSDGIDPLTEAVTLKVGSFAATLPAGAFVLDGDTYKYNGLVGRSHLIVRVSPLTEPSAYSFRAFLAHGDLAATTMKPQVQLAVGDDRGEVTLDLAKARFGKGRFGEQWVFGDGASGED